MEEDNRLYYKISEAAEIIGETTTLVRYWSEMFQEYLKPKRNAKQNRLYSKDDIAILKTLHYLIKEKGMTLEGARKALKGKTSSLSVKVETLSRLKSIRAVLVEIKDNL